MKITVFGAGYVGLVQAAILADVGHEVLCVDVDDTKVEKLKNGIIPIYEPGLSEIILSCVSKKTLEFTTDAKKAVEHGAAIFIAVGTPPDEDGSADLKHVLAVAKTIGRFSKGKKTIITKSTVPVGTADKVKASLYLACKENKNKLPIDAFQVVSNPEFLKEGSAVADCKKPDRIIIGAEDAEAIKVMEEIYEPFNRNHNKIIVMDAKSAELTKYAANCLLATKISFMNEMSNIAEKVGADIENVRLGIGSDPRIGSQFIYPGCGFGGSCFPKDVKALIKTSGDHGVEPSLLNAVEKVNNTQKLKVVEIIDKHYRNEAACDPVHGKTFAVWGLSFKPNTDDLREAPSLYVLKALLERGAIIQAFDPEALGEAVEYFSGYRNFLPSTQNDALVNADALIILTEWACFRAPDFKLLKTTLADSVIFDGRNMFSPQYAESKGLAYYGIGRGRTIN